MRRLQYRLIQLLDQIDDRLLGHRLMRFGLCVWIGNSSWWNLEPDEGGPDDV